MVVDGCDVMTPLATVARENCGQGAIKAAQ